MVETVTAPTNKLVAYKARAQKEGTRMPLKRGKSSKVIGENISELHSGATHARTAKKFGKKKADKQSVAIAMSEARKSGKEIPGAGHNPPKPHFTKTPLKHGGVPRHMRGRGMLSEKAMAIMGQKLAPAAKPAIGTHVASAGKSRSAKPDASASQPPRGKRNVAAAAEPSGPSVSSQATSL
jgi:hypothetical protein